MNQRSVSRCQALGPPTRLPAARNIKRAGNAVIELAIAVFLLFLVVFGSIEACNAVYLQQFISEASYQGAIAGIKPESTEADVQALVADFLSARDLTTAVVVVEGTDGTAFDLVPPGQPFRVRVTFPVSSFGNGPLIASFQDFSAESICTRQ